MANVTIATVVNVQNNVYVTLDLWSLFRNGATGALDDATAHAPSSRGYDKHDIYSNDTCSPAFFETVQTTISQTVATAIDWDIWHKLVPENSALELFRAGEKFFYTHGVMALCILTPACFPFVRQTKHYQQMVHTEYGPNAQRCLLGISTGLYLWRVCMHFHAPTMRFFVDGTTMHMSHYLVSTFLHLLIPFANQVVLGTKAAKRNAACCHNVVDIMLYVMSNGLTSDNGAMNANIVFFVVLGGLLCMLRGLLCMLCQKIKPCATSTSKCISFVVFLLLCIQAASPMMKDHHMACAFMLWRFVCDGIIIVHIEKDIYNAFALEDAADGPLPARPLAVGWE